MTETIQIQEVKKGKKKAIVKSVDLEKQQISIKKKEVNPPFFNIPSNKKIISKEMIQEGFQTLEELQKRRIANEKLLGKIKKKDENLFNKFFVLVNATDEQKKEYLNFLNNSQDIIEEISETLFPSREKFIGKPLEILEYLTKDFSEEVKKELDEIFRDKTITEDEAQEKINVIFKREGIEQHEYKLKETPKNPIDFSKITSEKKQEELLKILDEQMSLINEAIKGMEEAFNIQSEVMKLNSEYSVFVLDDDGQIQKRESTEQEGIKLFFLIGDETLKTMTNYQEYLKLTHRKGLSNLFSEIKTDYEEELEYIKELKIKLEEKEKLKTFKPFPIESAISFNDKLSNNFIALQNNTLIEIERTGGSQKKYKDSVLRVLIQNGEMTTTKILEPFDKIILQTIYSLIQKNNFFDIQMIKEHITGNKNRHEGKLDKEIESSINKLRTTLIQIEIPSEIQEQMKTPFEKSGIKDNILPIREYYVIKGGVRKSVFGFTSKSIYFEYEEARGQLITKNPKLLQGGIGNATKQTITLTDYISNRIEDMKHQQEKSKGKNYIEEMKFETIWKLILTEEDLKMKNDSLQKKKRRYVEDIETILKTYKKDNYIKDFERYSEGFKIKI